MNMSEIDPKILESVRKLVDDYRERCLWFLRPDHYPATADEISRTLEQIRRHGDVEAFRRTATIARWLSRPSSEKSADS